MNVSTLNRLYPNLNLSSIIHSRPISTLNLNRPTPPIIKEEPKPVERTQEEKPPVNEKKEEPKPSVKPPKPIPKPKEPVDETITLKGKPKDPEKQPDQPNKKIIYPKKGQRGIQKRISDEERKTAYLDRISRLSVKKAETKMQAMEEVLKENNCDKEELKKTERDLKKKLKLINEAYLFGINKTADNPEPSDNPELPDNPEPLK